MTDTYRILGNPVDERTPKLNLPLPHLLNDTRDDVPRLRTSLANIDAALNTLNMAVAQNAAVSATKAPLTGAGTSGTWNINIIGTAGKATIAGGITSFDNRAIKPNQINTYQINAYFVDKGLIDGSALTNNYMDLITLNGYGDASGGRVNALALTKIGAQAIYHYRATIGATAWDTPKQLAYTDSNITGTSAGAPWSGITGKPAVIAAGADAQAARAAIGAGTLSPYPIIVITANTTAQANTHYVIGTAGITLTLPVSVSEGDYFGISEAINSGSYAIDFGSIKLRGQTKGLQSIDANGSGANFKYKDATRGFV